MRPHEKVHEASYPFRSIMKSPNGVSNINSVSEGVRKGAAFGDGRCDSRFEEIHRRKWGVWVIGDWPLAGLKQHRSQQLFEYRVECRKRVADNKRSLKYVPKASNVCGPQIDNEVLV